MKKLFILCVLLALLVGDLCADQIGMNDLGLNALSFIHNQKSYQSQDRPPCLELVQRVAPDGLAITHCFPPILGSESVLRGYFNASSLLSKELTRYCGQSSYYSLALNSITLEAAPCKKAKGSSGLVTIGINNFCDAAICVGLDTTQFYAATGTRFLNRRI